MKTPTPPKKSERLLPQRSLSEMSLPKTATFKTSTFKTSTFKRATSNWLLAFAVLCVGALIAAACGSSDDDSASVAGVCPSNLVIQTDWFPEPEHAYLYQLIGTEGVIDADNGTYSGPLGDTGITLEIRAGGPYINFAAQTEQFYSDPDIFMAYVNTDEAIKSHVNAPVVGVFSNFEVGPQILMWNPEVFDFGEDRQAFEDIGESDATVLYFGGAAYMDYLTGTGVLSEDQVDGSYDGSPARFLVEDIVQQGFATNEPWRYENQIEGWLKPVKFELIHNSGLEIYQSTVSVRKSSVTEDADCLELIVPIMQQGLVDYMNDPEPINIRLDEIVKELDSFWTSSIESHNAGTVAMRDLGLVTDGDSGYVGDMNADRIQGVIDILNPIYSEQGVEGFSGGTSEVAPEDLFTNEFLDTSINLGY